MNVCKILYKKRACGSFSRSEPVRLLFVHKLGLGSEAIAATTVNFAELLKSVSLCKGLMWKNKIKIMKMVPSKDLHTTCRLYYRISKKNISRKPKHFTHSLYTVGGETCGRDDTNQVRTTPRTLENVWDRPRKRNLRDVGVYGVIRATGKIEPLKITLKLQDILII